MLMQKILTKTWYGVTTVVQIIKFHCLDGKGYIGVKVQDVEEDVNGNGGEVSQQSFFKIILEVQMNSRVENLLQLLLRT